VVGTSDMHSHGHSHGRTHGRSHGRIEDLVPHRGPMLLIDEVVDYDPVSESIVVRAELNPKRTYCRQGHFAGGHWYLEILAQSAAALATLTAMREDPNRSSCLFGYILSIQEFECTPAAVPDWGEVVIALCRFDSRLDHSASTQMELQSARGETLARAKMIFVLDPGGDLQSKHILSPEAPGASAELS
jgi:predicted hotdog family 3-hydroxylacyl-ACP dehydratase